MMQYNWHRSPHRPAYLYTHWAPSKYRLSLFLYKGHSRHSQRKSDTVIITLIFEARKWVINYLFDFSVMGEKTLFTTSRKHRLSLIDGKAGCYQFLNFFKDLGSLEISMKFDPKEGCLVIAVQRGVGLPEHQIKGPPGKLKGLLNTLSIYRFIVVHCIIFISTKYFLPISYATQLRFIVHRSVES